jgi:hypothetical protein
VTNTLPKDFDPKVSIVTCLPIISLFVAALENTEMDYTNWILDQNPYRRLQNNQKELSIFLAFLTKFRAQLCLNISNYQMHGKPYKGCTQTSESRVLSYLVGFDESLLH